MAEREVAVQHRERLARMRADKDVFMEKLKEERKTVYQVSHLQGFLFCHFYCFAASTGRRVFRLSSAVLYWSIINHVME
jgi:hypothetical protein